jgi:2-methylisocitrate lyase-like PEP mutase family enzyme
MNDQNCKADHFRSLHARGNPLVLFNIWDAGSAKTVAAAGAKAIATSSWSVAQANGHSDGEKIPRALAIDNLRRIPLNVMVGDTTPPVNVLTEHGVARVSFGPRPYIAVLKALRETAR